MDSRLRGNDEIFGDDGVTSVKETRGSPGWCLVEQALTVLGAPASRRLRSSHQGADLCGRLRDHVAIAAECANAKLQSLQTKAEHTQAQGTTADLLSALQSTVQNFDCKYVQARTSGSSLTQDLLDELASAFSSLGLSELQESRIQSIVQAKTCGLAEIYDFSSETQEALNEIAERLACILNPSLTPSDRKVCVYEVETEAPFAG